MAMSSKLEESMKLDKVIQDEVVKFDESIQVNVEDKTFPKRILAKIFKKSGQQGVLSDAVSCAHSLINELEGKKQEIGEAKNIINNQNEELKKILLLEQEYENHKTSLNDLNLKYTIFSEYR